VSDDEVMVLLVSVGFAGVFGLRALGPVGVVSRLHASRATRLAVLASWALAMLVVHWTLTTYAASDVRNDSLYIAFYDVMGLAWIATSSALFHRYGLSLRDDVLERRNGAALAAFSGALIGVAFTFAGGNVGEGPGWWCVVFASGLATTSLFCVWFALHRVARVPETITVERDVGTGIRVGGLLLACGMIFGNAAAGDWISASDTVISFARAAALAVPLAAMGVLLEFLLIPRYDRARPAIVLAPAAAVTYVIAAIAAVAAVRGQGLPL
jgi:hypothetical protein